MIVAGFGFRASATEESLRDALSRASGALQPTHFATLEAKAADANFHSFAKSAGAELVSVDARRLAAQQTKTQSTASRRAYGTGSVAEAAALSAVGPMGKLLVTRVISADRKATCAIASGDDT